MNFKKLRLLQTLGLIIRFKDYKNSNQIQKIKEELREVEEESIKLKHNQGDKERLVEELFDLKQAVETMLYNNIESKDVKAYEYKHIEKMKDKYDYSGLRYACTTCGRDKDEELMWNDEKNDFDVVETFCVKCDNGEEL